MKKTIWKVRAEYPHRGCSLVVDVELVYGHEEAVAIARAKRIVREEFGAVVEKAAKSWSAELVHEEASAT